VWLHCAAGEAFIEAGFVTEANVRQTHTAVLAVVLRATACVWRNEWQGRAAFQAVFAGLSIGCRERRFVGFRFSFLDWASAARWFGSFGAARA